MSTIPRILVIDDDPAFLRLTAHHLELGGYEVLTAQGGQAGLQAVIHEQPDLVILDIIMPDMDGFEICQRIRNLTDVPIIMLTARHKEEDIIRGLDLGADDYVVKPCRMNVLLARVKATLRRSQISMTAAELHNYHDDWLSIDLVNRVVEVNGQRVRLSATEFNLLSLLLKYAGRVVESYQILQQVWGPEYEEEVAYVRVYVSHLRQKIEPDPSEPTYIQTERQAGYRFLPRQAE